MIAALHPSCSGLVLKGFNQLPVIRGLRFSTVCASMWQCLTVLWAGQPAKALCRCLTATRKSLSIGDIFGHRPMFNRAGSNSGGMLVHSHVCNSCELGFHLTNDKLHPYPSTALSVSQLGKTIKQQKQCYPASEIIAKVGVSRNDKEYR